MSRVQTHIFGEDDAFDLPFQKEIDSLDRARRSQQERLAEFEQQLATIKTTTVKSRVFKEAIVATAFVACLAILLNAL